MTNFSSRLDKNPMSRRAGGGPLSDPPSNYALREVEPSEADEFVRRAGSERQAQYGRASGVSGPGASKWLIDRQGLDLSAAATVAFRVRVGSIQESSGQVPLVTLQRQSDTLLANSNNRVHIWLEKESGAYYIRANIYDSSGAVGITTSLEIGVSVGDDAQVALYTAGFGSGTSVTLNVSGATDTDTMNVGTYLLTDCVPALFSGTSAEGQPSVIDPLNLFSSDVSGDGIADITSREPSTTPVHQHNFTGSAPIAPSTGGGDAFPYPGPPLVSGGELNFSGFSGVLRVGYNSVFDQFFLSPISSLASQVFAVKVKYTRKFYTGNHAVVLAEIPGLLTVGLDTSGNPELTYSDQTKWTTSGLSSSAGAEQTIWIGCDGTNLFAYNGSATDTEPLTGVRPSLDYRRTPDLFIGAGEDPADLDHFHGAIAEFALFNYAATSDDGVPIFDLDLTRPEPSDKSKYRIPVTSEPHTAVDRLPLRGAGPVQDEPHAAAAAGEILVGAGTVDTGDATYLTASDAEFTSDVVASRLGDKVFAAEPGGALALVDTSRNQCRPLGVPQVQAEVTARKRGSGVLDAVYSYGARYITGEGTYGPIRRLKSVDALGGASVLIGASGGTGSGEEDFTELGESYGLTNAGYENYFEWDDGALTTDSDSDGYTAESYLAFPDFGSLEEGIFDRGARLSSSNSSECAWPAFPTGIPVDFTSDFSLQTAFELDDTLNSTAADDSMCIHAIGHNDPDPWTRPYMLCLYKDAAGWGGGSYRLVAFRATGRRDNAYTVTVVEDAGIWSDGDRYNVFSVRRGNALEIRVHNQTDDVWYHFTTKAAAGTAATSMSAFFDGKNNHGHKNKATYLHHGAPAQKEEGGSSGSMMEQVDTVSSTGDPNGVGIHWINPLAAGTTYFHARAWSRALGKSQIVYDSELRYAAQAGGPLAANCLSDVAFINDDPVQSPDKFWDRQKGVYWNVYAEDGTTGKITNPDRARFDQVDPGAATISHGAYMTDNAETDPLAAEYQLYASSVGDGSIVLSTGAESYVVASKLWDPGASAAQTTIAAISGFDPENFNWYTTPVVFTTDSTEYDLAIKGLAINGQEITDNALSGPTTLTLTKASFRIYLGGFDGVTNAKSVKVGEFRLWSKNRYDDSSEQYDFLITRVAENERTDLYLYATFQPADENDPVDGEFEDRGSLTGVWLKSPTSGSWDGSNDAEIIDGRELEEDITDPAPATRLPSAPYPHIVAIELLRSAGVNVADPDDEAQISRALLSADGAALQSLAVVPIGTNSYIDNQLDATLGAPAAEGTGFTPTRANGLFLWEGRLGLFRESALWLSEPGPFGFESFTPAGRLEIQNQGTSDIVAAAPYAGALAVFGSDWGAVLAGTPEQYRTFDISGVGAQSARSVASYGGQMFVLGDTGLWIIPPPTQNSAPEAVNFGLPVEDLLPSQGRLSVSSLKASLYVIDETTGLTLRFYFPTQRWYLEDRDALSVTDLDSGLGIVHTGGAYSTENANLAGDDLNATSTEITTGTIASVSTITVSADPDVPVGTRVLVIDDQDSPAEALTRVVSATDSTVTVTTGALTGLTGTCTLHFGVSDEGHLLDTGWFANPTGYSAEVMHLRSGVLAGTGWEVAIEGAADPGSRSAASQDTYTSITGSSVTLGGGPRGQWSRVRVRNRSAELGNLDRIQIMQSLEQ